MRGFRKGFNETTEFKKRTWGGINREGFRWGDWGSGVLQFLEKHPKGIIETSGGN